MRKRVDYMTGTINSQAFRENRCISYHHQQHIGGGFSAPAKAYILHELGLVLGLRFLNWAFYQDINKALKS